MQIFALENKLNISNSAELARVEEKNFED